MSSLANTIFSVVFLVMALANTFLMYRLWAYPFDHSTHTSSAPRGLMLVHRLTGYVYLAIYVVMMAQMVPRLWTFQVDFPARTVAHLLLGLLIGTLLVVKIVIVRFFKHMESSLVPMLGTSLLVATVLMLGLTIPVNLREVYLSRTVQGGAFSNESVERVATLLPTAGLPGDAPIEEIATSEGLRQGRGVLLRQCIQCHDLRTILVKPRTPENWHGVVQRMADRSQLLDAISPQDQWAVTAYLVAISPDLQGSAAMARSAEAARSEARAVDMSAIAMPAQPEAAAFTLADAQFTFEITCSLCHELSDVDAYPPANQEEARDLVARMIDNGLEASEADLQQIIFYLAATYGP